MISPSMEPLNEFYHGGGGAVNKMSALFQKIAKSLCCLFIVIQTFCKFLQEFENKA